MRLLQRTTRRIGLTPEGETYLRVAATLGFGRRHVAPALSRFVRQHPEGDVQLHLAGQPVHIAEQSYDLEVRVGELPDARLSARLLAHNQRALLAAPAYPRHRASRARRGDALAVGSGAAGACGATSAGVAGVAVAGD